MNISLERSQQPALNGKYYILAYSHIFDSITHLTTCEVVNILFGSLIKAFSGNCDTTG